MHIEVHILIETRTGSALFFITKKETQKWEKQKRDWEKRTWKNKTKNRKPELQGHSS